MHDVMKDEQDDEALDSGFRAYSRKREADSYDYEEVGKGFYEKEEEEEEYIDDENEESFSQLDSFLFLVSLCVFLLVIVCVWI